MRRPTEPEGVAPLTGRSLPILSGTDKKTINRRVPLLMFIFAGAGAIRLASVQSTANHLFGAAPASVTTTARQARDEAPSITFSWLASVQSTANHLFAAPASVTTKVDASSSNDGDATQARDEAPSLRIDLPKFEKPPSDEEEILAWEVAPRRKIDQKDAPLPATVCACNKCGTTSFYNALYEMTHGKSWTHDGFPWIQALDNDEWWTDVHAARKTDWDAFAGANASKNGTNSFALIRDPKERLLSAWKTKIRCSPDKDPEFDHDDWWKFTYPLMELAGMVNMTLEGRMNEYEPGLTRWEPCLDVSDFLLVMLNVHSQGKQGLLNGHFRPQHLWCFLNAPPEKWTHVVTAKSPDGACRLESVVMGKDSHTRSDSCAMGKKHATKDISAYAKLTEADRMLLDAITREEYEVLGPYL